MKKTELKNFSTWHSQALGDVFARVKSKKEGLSEREVAERLSGFGFNKIVVAKDKSLWLLFFKQFLSPLMFLLLAAGVVTIVVGVYLDAIIIFVALFFNTLVGFFEERRALKSFRKLRSKQKFFTLAKRGGDWKKVSSESVVPGDIIKIQPGDKIPADGRIINSYELKNNEAVLTGESSLVDKEVGALPQETALADRKNMVWKGSSVGDGKAEVVIIATGNKTEFGKIYNLLEDVDDVRTPFEKKIAKLGRFLTGVILSLTLLIVGIGLLVGESLIDIFLVAVSVAVSAIPESLPIAVTVILAIGMTRILSEKGLVKKLSATEALGSTSIILTDKTGTLTMGEMRVDEVMTATRNKGVTEITSEEGGGESIMPLEIAVLSTETVIENYYEDPSEWKIRGRSTDRAMVLKAIEEGVNPKELFNKYKEIKEIPFNSDRKFSLSFREENEEKNFAFFAGAPEVLLKFASKIQLENRSHSMTNDERTDIRDIINSMANRGLRVIMVGYKSMDSRESIPDKIIDHEWAEAIKDSTFVGLIGLKDPVRKDVNEVIEITRRAGIKTVVVTGDHSLTAQSVAKEVGLLPKKRSIFNIMEGRELEELDLSELTRQVRSIDIFARVSPEHKVKIVDAWQRQGEVVAMSGDGVNDAPALKKADVGIAVGTGTDIAKEASDMILLDNSFSTIVSAVKEGRVIIDNLKKVITYLLSDSFSEILLISVSLIAGLPLPVLPAQILWVNFIEDSFPSIALAFDPAEKDVMDQSPMPTDSPLIDKEMKFLIFVVGLVTDLILLSIFLFLLKQTNDLQYIRTVVFAALAINSLFYSFSMKSLRNPIWKIKFWNNRYLLGSFVLGFVLLLGAIYLPPLQLLLRTVSLGILEWIILIGFGILNITAIEVGKWIFIRQRVSSSK